MQKRKASLAVIFGIVFIDLVGFGIVIPVLPLYAERFGASPLMVGGLLAVYSLMSFLFSPVLGRLSDRIGRRPVLLVSILGSSVGFLIMGLAGSLPFLFLGRIIDGITGGNISTAQAYIADITAPHERSKGMGLIGAAFGLGFIFGPAIGGVMSHFSLAAPLLFAAALALLNAVAVYLFLPESLPKEHRTRDVSENVPFYMAVRKAKGSPLALVLGAYFFSTVAFSLLTATYPLFASHRFGYGAPQVGYIFAGMGIVGAVIQGGMMGLLVRTFGDSRLASVGAVLLAAGLVFLPVSSSAPLLFLATAAIGLGHALVVTPLNGLASKVSRAAEQGKVLGMMQSCSSLARIIGPVLGGWMLNLDLLRVEAYYGRAPYWTAAAIVLVACGLTLCIRVSGEAA
ncbi:MAG: MFS transporter [Candidatus Omnitrophota bacterium]|nr:MFS transporter [Candidatus Omnitrophota bacterium]